MRKWQDMAAPDDPNSWADVSNMWPTKRGTYETADFSSGTSKTAAASNFVVYAFCAKDLTSTREYVVDAGKVWQYSSEALTDRTGTFPGVGVTNPMMAQFGNITILVNGAGTKTVYSTGANFADLAGAPKAAIVVVQSNAVLMFNTDTSADGWAASDVGDYTNWTTGEAASGRIITTPGPILGAVPFGNDVMVFKSDSIYRMTYVGGVVKWQIQLVWKGLGSAYLDAYTASKYQVVATRRGVVFNARTDGNGVYIFDGSSEPRQLNPITTIDTSSAVFVYNPIDDVLTIAPALGSSSTGTYRTGTSTSSGSLYYYYSFVTDQWGKGVGSDAEDYESGTTFPTSAVNGVLQGDYYARAETSSKPVYWRYRNVTTGAFYRCAPVTPPSTATCYLQTSKIGQPNAKTTFRRVIPLLRRRTDLGTDSATCDLTLYTEREDTTASTTRTGITESTGRKRFDLMGGTCEDTFGRIKVTWNALDVEVDDFLIDAKTVVPKE